MVWLPCVKLLLLVLLCYRRRGREHRPPLPRVRLLLGVYLSPSPKHQGPPPPYVFGTKFFVSYERSETMDGCTEMIICAQSQKNRGDSLTIAHGGRFRPAFLEMSWKCVTALCEHTV